MSGITRSAILLAALCLIIHSPIAAFAADVNDEVARIQKAYEGIRDIKGGFAQKSYIKDLKRTDAYKGQFSIKAGRMKWDYRGDKPQTVYINGDEIVIYQKSERQAFSGRFDRQTYGQAPIALLAGLGDMRREFEVSLKGDRLLLKPRRGMGNIVSIELVPSDGEFPIEALVIKDTLGNRIDIRLSDVKINTGLKDGMFDFSPPEGVNVIKQ